MIVVSDLSLKDENFIAYFHHFKIKKDFDSLQFVDRPFLACPCLCGDVIIVTFFDVIDDCVQHFYLQKTDPGCRTHPAEPIG